MTQGLIHHDGSAIMGQGGFFLFCKVLHSDRIRNPSYCNSRTTEAITRIWLAHVTRYPPDCPIPWKPCLSGVLFSMDVPPNSVKILLLLNLRV